MSLHTVGKIVFDWVIFYEKQYGYLTKNLKFENLYNPEITLFVSTPKVSKHIIERKRVCSFIPGSSIHNSHDL